MRILGLAAVAASMLAVPQVAQAATTTLTFDGAICGVNGDQACSNGSQIGQNYGDSAGVDVSHQSYTLPETTYEPYLKYWGSGYGDLDSAVWGGADPVNYYAEFQFTANPGYEVRLLSFDAGCYLGRASCRTISYSVLIGSSVVDSGSNVPTNYPGHVGIDVTMDWVGDDGSIALLWGPDAYDTGLDNIVFEWRLVQDVGGIPEPATWAMMILGFGLVGAASRSRRTARVRALD